ncbi:MAG: hypothetical protein JJE53_00685 [Candidatus Pacebacteria bacterium]|nr:hypothetical protein [Candidatus Paceibacterota bacterium]
MKNTIKKGGQLKVNKGRVKNNEMFSAHRLDPDDKNFANKPAKKKLQVNQIAKRYL